VLAVAEVELVDRGHQPGGARQRAEELAELLSDVCVLEAAAGDHVVDALPDLVEAIHARLAATLDQSVELGRTRAKHQRWHRPSLP
jgi:hypothetical protein